MLKSRFSLCVFVFFSTPRVTFFYTSGWCFLFLLGPCFFIYFHNNYYGNYFYIFLFGICLLANAEFTYLLNYSSTLTQQILGFVSFPLTNFYFFWVAAMTFFNFHSWFCLWLITTHDGIDFLTNTFITENLLLRNSLNLIHPPMVLIFLIFMIILCGVGQLVILRLNSISSLFFFFQFILKALLFFLYGYMITLFLGSFWALQMGTWGGWWVWDFSEVLLVLFLIPVLFSLHFKVKVNDFFFVVLLLFLNWILMWFFLLLNTNLLSQSLHLFFKPASFVFDILAILYTIFTGFFLLFIKRLPLPIGILVGVSNYSFSFFFILFHSFSFFITLFCFFPLVTWITLSLFFYYTLVTRRLLRYLMEHFFIFMLISFIILNTFFNFSIFTVDYSFLKSLYIFIFIVLQEEYGTSFLTITAHNVFWVTTNAPLLLSSKVFSVAFDWFVPAATSILSAAALLGSGSFLL